MPLMSFSESPLVCLNGLRGSRTELQKGQLDPAQAAMLTFFWLTNSSYCTQVITACVRLGRLAGRQCLPARKKWAKKNDTNDRY